MNLIAAPIFQTEYGTFPQKVYRITTTRNNSFKKLNFKRQSNYNEQRDSRPFPPVVRGSIITPGHKAKTVPSEVILTSELKSIKDRLIIDMSKLKSINSRKFSMTKISEILPQVYEN